MITGQACDTNTGGCAAGEQCLPLVSTSTVGVCSKPGTCDTASGLCGLHTPASATAQVGATCGGDQDCGAAMSCAFEYDPKAFGLNDHGTPCTGEDCCGYCDPTTQTCEGSCAIHARNGYCVISGCVFATPTDFKEFACPTGSVCNRMYWGGMCMKECQ